MKLHPSLHGFVARLARDTAGNTLAMIAAAMVPLLAIVGGGVDVSRGYLAQSRLQQACDAGVLAARKRMGATVSQDGQLSTEARRAGRVLFDSNFSDGIYGTTQRGFEMTLNADYSVAGAAAVVVPTTVMTLFGYNDFSLNANCEARLNFSNTDIMMVLDVTGSMAMINPGDTTSRIDALKVTAKSFYTQMTGAAAPGTRIRFGFLPYSTNVNVGRLLRDEWVNTSWKYNGRVAEQVPGPLTSTTYNRNWRPVSGSVGPATIASTYPATRHEGSPGSTYVDQNERVVTVPASGSYYTCDTPAPTSNYSASDELLDTATYPFAGPPAGTQTVQSRRLSENGTRYSISRSGPTCNVVSQTYDNRVQTYERVTEPRQSMVTQYRYGLFDYDVGNWRIALPGCVEERETYEITDYDSIDFGRALDLDIDLVPNGSARTKWSPLNPGVVYERSMRNDGTGTFTKAEVVSTQNFLMPGALNLAACPPPAKALAPLTPTEVDSYLATLFPGGATYHDIGMIWGGRMLSPNGLFAADNADQQGKPTSRHMIFLTDGLTAPLDIAYGAYGIEPLDGRRWTPTSPLTLTQVVEKRLGVACNEVKKRNIAIWVIGFGTNLNTVLTECAGEGRYFEAKDSEELEQVFTTIAKRMGDLRISR